MSESIQDLYTQSSQPSKDQLRAMYGTLAHSTKTPLEPKATSRCGDQHHVNDIGTFICTRSKGHSGKHEAHYAKGVAAKMWLNMTTWQADAEADVLKWKAKAYNDAVIATQPEAYFKLHEGKASCGKFSGTYNCTLIAGHEGLHEAMVSEYTSVCAPFEEKVKPKSSMWSVPLYAAYTNTSTDFKVQLKEPEVVVTPDPKAWQPDEICGINEAVYEKDWKEYPSSTHMVPFFDHSHGESDCGKHANGYSCTRPINHPGPHEAHYVYVSSHTPCGPPWWDDPIEEAEE